MEELLINLILHGLLGMRGEYFQKFNRHELFQDLEFLFIQREANFATHALANGSFFCIISYNLWADCSPPFNVAALNSDRWNGLWMSLLPLNTKKKNLTDLDWGLRACLTTYNEKVKLSELFV